RECARIPTRGVAEWGPRPSPPQPAGEKLCLADYFQPIGGRPDLVAFQAVSVGHEVEPLDHPLEREVQDSRGAYVGGLAWSTAEALADVVNRRVRAEMGVGDDRGRRYSWGYG